MKRKIAKLTYILSFVLGIVLLLIAAVAKLDWLMRLGTLGMVAGMIISRYFLRCPYCGRWPRRGSIFEPHCPRCGEELDD